MHIITLMFGSVWRDSFELQLDAYGAVLQEPIGHVNNNLLKNTISRVDGRCAECHGKEELGYQPGMRIQIFFSWIRLSWGKKSGYGSDLKSK